MNNTGPLSFDSYIRDTGFKSQIDAMERQIRGLTTTVVQESQKVDSAFERMGRLAATYFTFDALKDLPLQLINVRGEFQNLELSFATMLKSKEKGAEFLRQGAEFAAKTPFELTDVAKAQKVLLAYGFSVESIIPTLTRLGDIAAGTGANIGELVAAYGQIKTQGTAQQDDLNKFIERGVNLTPLLAKQLGVADGEVRKLVANGKVGFAEVEKAIGSLADEGGMFSGLMAQQSKSLTGLTSNLRDAWRNMLNDIGKDNEGLLASAISGTTALVQNYEPVLDILKVLVATYGSYKAAVIATTVAQSVSVTAGNVVAWLKLASTINSAKDAQIAFNLATSANPYAIAAALMVGLIAAVVLYRKELSATEQAEKMLTDAREKANAGVNSETAQIEALKRKINDEKLSRDARNKALKDLIAISPQHLNALTLENARTAEGTKLINDYITAKKKEIELKEIDKEMTLSIERQLAAKQGKSEVGFFDRMKGAMQAGSGMGGVQQAEAYRKANEGAVQRIRAQQDKDEDAIQAKLKSRIQVLEGVGSATASAEGQGQKAVAKTVEYYDKLIAQKKEAQAQKAANPKEFQQYQKQIDDLERAKRRLTGEKTAAEKKAEKDADKTGPFGSLSYWEAIAQKAQEVIDKTPSTDSAKLAQQNARKLDAERRAEAIRKSLVQKSFGEELEDKKKQYQLYQQWVDAYGQQAANEQFDTLIKSGNSYVDYLNTQIERLEAERATTGLDNVNAKNLSTLLTERDDATGKKSAIDAFEESLQDAGRQAQSLTEYLEILRVKQAQLNAADNSSTGIAKRLALAEESKNTLQALYDQLREYRQAVEGSEQQRLAIVNRYTDLRTAVEEKGAKLTLEQREQILADLNKAEKREFAEFSRRAAEASDAYRAVNDLVEQQGRKGLEKKLSVLRTYLAELEKTVGVEDKLYRQTAKDIQEGERSLKSGKLNDYQMFAGLAGELGDALAEVNGGIGKTGQLMSGIVSQANLIRVSFEQSGDSVEDQNARIAAGIQGIIGLINIVTSSARERKQAEEDYYRSITAQQREYNLALNEQIGLRSQLNESVFAKDYQGRLADGVNQMQAAQKSYQDFLKKLNEGKAKEGQRNAVDWNKVGKAAGSGATIGGAIGTAVVPVVGTAIGAAVGAIYGGVIGLIAGKKKKDEFGSLLEIYPQLIQKSKDGVDELNVSLAETLIKNNLVDGATKELLQTTIDWQKQVQEAKDAIKGVISELAGGLGDNLRNGLVNAFKEGEDAANAFGDSVSGILESLLSQMLFSQTLGPALKQLEGELTASVGESGDNNWIDDFGRFFGKADELTKLFNAGLEDAQATAAQYGMNVFNKSNANPNKTALSGAIKGVSEETAGVLAGQMNAIRIQQAETGVVIRQQLVHLSVIADNSRFLRYLQSIDERLEKQNNSDPLRARGI